MGYLAMVKNNEVRGVTDTLFNVLLALRIERGATESGQHPFRLPVRKVCDVVVMLDREVDNLSTTYSAARVVASLASGFCFQ